MDNFPVNLIFTVTITLFVLWTAGGNPMESPTIQPKLDERPTIRRDRNPEDLAEDLSEDFSYVENATQSSNCEPVEYELKDVTILDNKDLFLKTENITLRSLEYEVENGSIFTCVPFHPKQENESALNCSEKFHYERDEFSVLPNNSAIVGDYIFPEGEFELSGDYLITCAPEEPEMTVQDYFIYVGQIGSAISIVSLIAHLLTFVFVRTLRNLPGYNLASVSVAFLFAYSFVLIGQIPEVIGLYCVISAVLQQHFFLAAFFCTNVLAFDVWKTLKHATEELIIASQNSRKRQFIWYSLYAWGAPLVITTISVVVDNSESVHPKYKPEFGKFDVCSITNMYARGIFFMAPAFTLLVVNVIFFVMSSWMISSNTMKCTKDQSRQNVKLNYILYVRLAIMMGLTWIVGLVAIISQIEWMWFIFDLLNSLQGLLLLLLFTCRRKVFRRLYAKTSIKLSPIKPSNAATNSSSVSTETDSSGAKSSHKNSQA